MVAPLRPASVKVEGNLKWIFVSTMAAQASPLVTEGTAASSLDISMMVFNTSGMPDQNTNRVTKTKRLGDTVLYEQIGDTTQTGFDLIMQLDPQGAALSDGVKAWEKFGAGGVTGYFWRRTGLPIATDLATGQFVDVYPVEIGPGMPTTVGDNETAEAAFKCTVAITGPASFRKALA
jgi:hypothetical protein